MAKSHIIPKSFINFDGLTHKIIVSPDSHRKRTPTGLFDENILCVSCESNFSYIDSQAAQILLNKFENEIIPFGDERDTLACQIPGKYFNTIKRFLIYTLWKASVSELAEFRAIKLGPYEEIIKNLIIHNKNIDLYDYSFMAYKVKHPIGNLFPFNRLKKDYDGLRYYCLLIADYIFDIKIDQQKPCGVYKIASEHPHVVFICLETIEGNIREAMRDVISRHEKKFGVIPNT